MIFLYGRLDLSYITIWCIITLVYCRRSVEKKNRPRKEMMIFSHVLAFQEDKETCFRQERVEDLLEMGSQQEQKWKRLFRDPLSLLFYLGELHV